MMIPEYLQKAIDLIVNNTSASPTRATEIMVELQEAGWSWSDPTEVGTTDESSDFGEAEADEKEVGEDVTVVNDVYYGRQTRREALEMAIKAAMAPDFAETLENARKIVSFFQEDHSWTAPRTEEETNLIKHAKYELERSGMSQDIYGDMLPNAILDLLRVFSAQGHSGASGSYTLHVFKILADFGNLTPLTDDPEEWYTHEENHWQSKRNSSCFSMDKGKTYIDNDEIERNEDGSYKRDGNGNVIQPIHTSVDHTKPIHEEEDE